MTIAYYRGLYIRPCACATNRRHIVERC